MFALDAPSVVIRGTHWQSSSANYTTHNHIADGGFPAISRFQVHRRTLNPMRESRELSRRASQMRENI